MNFGFNLLSGLLANFIFLMLITGVSYFLFNINRRKKLYDFFNITDSHRLIIYLSNLKILKGGSQGFDMLPRSFQGYAAPFGEYMASGDLKNIFYYPVPSISEQPGILKKLLVADIQINILLSPLDIKDIDLSDSIVTVGSPGYNIVSRYIEEKMKSNAVFDLQNNSMKINKVFFDQNTNHGFLERIVDKENKRSFFYTAGLSEIGTVGSLFYLSTHWEILYKEFGKDKPFTIMLGFDNNNIKNPFVIYKE
jgi:hypothetical protein